MRIRAVSVFAILASAQALCLQFAQRFAGIGVGDRHIRVHADDTG